MLFLLDRGNVLLACEKNLFLVKYFVKKERVEFTSLGGKLKIFLIIFFICLFQASRCNANIASVSYVQSATSTKVDTSANTQQTMAGEYVITGTLKVPTQPLPTAE